MASALKTATESGSQNALIVKMAEKYTIDTTELLDVLKSTAFKQRENVQISNEQMYALLVVADQYNLNPFLKEIYAFPDKNGGIIPVVGVDGWNRIANDHPHFDGVEFKYSSEILQGDGAMALCPAWVEATVYRNDRTKPTTIREYLDECYRAPFRDNQTGYTKNGPWQTHPKRLLRHKALIQTYRVAFSFAGLYDEDEAYRIIDAQSDDGEKCLEEPKVVPLTSKVVDALTVENQQDEVLQDEKTLVIDFNQKEIDEFLSKLITRAGDTNQWQAAKDLVSDRLEGNAEQYALNALEKAERENVPASSEEVHANELQSESTNSTVVMMVPANANDSQSETHHF